MTHLTMLTQSDSAASCKDLAEGQTRQCPMCSTVRAKGLTQQKSFSRTGNTRSPYDAFTLHTTAKGAAHKPTVGTRQVSQALWKSSPWVRSASCAKG